MAKQLKPLKSLKSQVGDSDFCLDITIEYSDDPAEWEDHVAERSREILADPESFFKDGAIGGNGRLATVAAVKLISTRFLTGPTVAGGEHEASAAVNHAIPHEDPFDAALREVEEHEERERYDDDEHPSDAVLLEEERYESTEEQCIRALRAARPALLATFNEEQRQQFGAAPTEDSQWPGHMEVLATEVERQEVAECRRLLRRLGLK